ncbi:MAG: RNA-binding protein [Pseudomonadota bacterium]
MEVFIGNLAEKTTLNDVMKFFRGFAKKASLRMAEKKLEDGTRVIYAVAEFDSEKLAHKAIKKLNGGLLRGQHLVLREFVHRTYTNERRDLNWRNKPWSGVERRKGERRNRVQPKHRDDFADLVENSKQNEKQEQETKDNFNVSAYRNMARKL